MTDTTDNAQGPELIAFRRAYMNHAITNGPLMEHPDYVQYIRADLAADTLADPRVKALVNALRAWKGAGSDRDYYEAVQKRNAALAALEGGKDDG